MAVIGSHLYHDGKAEGQDVTVLDYAPPSAKQLPASGGGPMPALPPSLLTRLVVCLQYGFVSVAITLFNRAVFSVYHFNYPSTVTLVQILVSLLFMYVLRAAGQMKFGVLDRRTARKVAPLAFFWWLYVVSGVTALRFLNVPMYSVIRRSTTLLVVAGEYFVFHKRPTHRSLVALLVMVGGAIVAGLTDLTFNLAGYIWVCICVASTAAYLLLIRKLQESTGLNQSTLLLYSNVLALPLMAAFMLLATNEAAEVVDYPQLWEPRFILFLLFSCSQAFLLNLCIFRCTLINSPLAANVTGQMKDILTTALGMLLFGGMQALAMPFSHVKYSALNVGGIVLGLLGSITYSAVSYLESKAPNGSKARESPPNSMLPSHSSGIHPPTLGAGAMERAGLLNNLGPSHPGRSLK